MKYIVKLYSLSTICEWERMHEREPECEDIDLGEINIPIGIFIAGNKIVLPYPDHRVAQIYDVKIDITRMTIFIYCHAI